MDTSKTNGRIYYEELRLLSKDTFEAIHRLKKVCISRDSHYVFINDHIGDVVIALGYLRAFREKICAEKITLIMTEKYRKLAENYLRDYETIVFLSEYELYRIFLLNATVFGEKYLIKEYPNVIFINPADSAKLGFDYLKFFPEMNLEKMIKYGNYTLSENAIFNPLQEIVNSGEDKRVLITIDARTIELKDISLYKTLIPKLKAWGYEIYTNAKDNECLEDSIPVYKELHELREFLGNGVLLGVRSGLHDLLLYQKCKVVAIYPENYEYGNLFSLNMMPKTVASYIELKLSGNNEFDTKKIMDFIRGDK